MSLNFTYFIFALMGLWILSEFFISKFSSNSLRIHLYQSLFWIGAALVFNGWVYHQEGAEKAWEFLSGYLLEKSLSVDNIFVFILIFRAFGLSFSHQQRVLTWGMIGAVVLRGSMIYGGIGLVHAFHWLTYGLGLFLLGTGVAFFCRKEESSSSEPWVLQWGKAFFKAGGNLQTQRLFWGALVTAEAADALFALDSIPAIFGVTLDPFIIYTSNLFALLGLRSLYFLVTPLLEKLSFLEKGLGGILAFIGLKMLMEPFYKMTPGMTLGVIGLFLGVTLGGSLLFGRGGEKS